MNIHEYQAKQLLAKFGVPVAVAINKFVTDTDAELAEVAKAAETSKRRITALLADGR